MTVILYGLLYHYFVNNISGEKNLSRRPGVETNDCNGDGCDNPPVRRNIGLSRLDTRGNLTRITAWKNLLRQGWCNFCLTNLILQHVFKRRTRRDAKRLEGGVQYV